MDAKKTATIGCIHCWETWGLLLYSKKRTKQYAGKSPSRIQVTEDIKETLQSFESELMKALANEDYEKAAAFRDKIRSIKMSGRHS